MGQGRAGLPVTNFNPFKTKTAPRFVFGDVGNFLPAPHPQFVQSLALGRLAVGWLRILINALHPPSAIGALGEVRQTGSFAARL